MKRYIAIAAVASAFLVGAISGCKEPVTTPVFEDGSQYATTDNGKTWYKLSSTCYSCQCVSGSGQIAGTCTYNGHEFSCQDWCYPGK